MDSEHGSVIDAVAVTQYEVDYEYDEEGYEAREFINNSEWELKSFSRRNGNCDPYAYVSRINKYGEPVPANIGIRRRLEAGTAFVVSCYSHSCEAWSLMGEGMQDRWDTARVAGIILRREPFSKKVATYVDRQAAARRWLRYYTDAVNNSAGNFKWRKLTADEPDADWERLSVWFDEDEKFMLKELVATLPADASSDNVRICSNAKVYHYRLMSLLEQRAHNPAG